MILQSIKLAFCVCFFCFQQRAVARLLEENSATLETKKLQVAFHSLYAFEERKLKLLSQQKDDSNREKIAEIVDIAKKLKSDAQGVLTLFMLLCCCCLC